MVCALSRVLLALCTIALVAADSTSWVVTLPGQWTKQAIETAEPTFTVDSIYYSQRRNYTLVVFSYVASNAAGAPSSDSVAASLHSALGVQPSNISANDASVHKTIIPETPVGTVSCYSGLSWALDRIDQRSKTLNQCYDVHFTGASVHSYIIDTGVDVTHPDFGGRATLDFTTLGSYEDCDGHGTHVAGLVGSNTYGVAPGVRLHSVRVLDCTGSGTLGDLANGIAWVLDNHQPPSIINLSLGYVSGL